MKTGWKEAWRLGTEGACFPHVLADAHGYCLRLGPNPRKDEKYYSQFSTLLEGIIEHALRRRLLNASTMSGLEEIHREVRFALQVAYTQRRSLVRSIILQETLIGELRGPAEPYPDPDHPARVPCHQSFNKPIHAMEEGS